MVNSLDSSLPRGRSRFGYSNLRGFWFDRKSRNVLQTCTCCVVVPDIEFVAAQSGQRQRDSELKQRDRSSKRGKQARN
ncbi:hypothetical protein ONZ51_g7439 [Trametes cubensis]|uniref:Uncharacterized protein n=1 Tax=Trametes cubensis TaxID=1111947 RepID=A0AAD7X945_9APHY|nr:hypothetical protein ONZ51_g7439 [Trametes cubensis]